MDRLEKIRVEYVTTIPDTKEDGVLYLSRYFGLAVMMCPCGCGEQCVMPLQPNDERGWVIGVDRDKVTLSPSILETTCPNKSHFFIRKNKIVWI